MYKSYDVVDNGSDVLITYEFVLEPDIVFHPKVTIPYAGDIRADTFVPYVFHLGLIEAISYWKAACPSEFVVEAGQLTQEQIRFWYDLFIHGLGEFFYRNDIDFTRQDFLQIINGPASGPGNRIRVSPRMGDATKPRRFSLQDSPGDLILVGGGKDSAVTLGILKGIGNKFQTMVVNPTDAALANILEAGVVQPAIIEREIDPKLLKLNGAGYLNGHTPFSAYLAFLGITVAFLYGNDHVVVSNERSAEEGNVVYRGMEVNHQYSKSFRFEQAFRQYCRNFFDDSPLYFSFLRPLNDIQIGATFAGYPKFFSTFRSCNVGSKTNAWCGRCAKCAFTYLTLFPYISYQDITTKIFGRDYLQSPEIIKHTRGLVGLTPVKPFECVGTRDESKLAVVLCIEKYAQEGIEIPEGLLKIKSDLNPTDQEVAQLKEEVLHAWGDTYNLTPEYVTTLRNAWSKQE